MQRLFLQRGYNGPATVKSGSRERGSGDPSGPEVISGQPDVPTESSPDKTRSDCVQWTIAEQVPTPEIVVSPPKSDSKGPYDGVKANKSDDDTSHTASSLPVAAMPKLDTLEPTSEMEELPSEAIAWDNLGEEACKGLKRVKEYSNLLEKFEIYLSRSEDIEATGKALLWPHSSIL